MEMNVDQSCGYDTIFDVNNCRAFGREIRSNRHNKAVADMNVLLSVQSAGGVDQTPAF